ncbi:MAG: hypothetical protein A2928_00445 [Candidatus Taylorbacteria bacterium RIFCSPLOWO2_01_FULL_45_15b]|uniref:Uncharacterized protein n=1 Tax=Candidatus Taylorbacteria bacterium RIFCSPLOWO2_01_FULL_45_15b TaxID=1802319 RepID=A0A1G2N7Q6_9BACT|nr:MAG: hypothetical protein A2928_00445 [Candidatus Taylorbacteria bacterium RIFCSPLOWO2_01_FULL_45_15b]
MHTTTLDKIVSGDLNIFKCFTWTGRRRKNGAVRLIKCEKRFAKRAFRRAAKASVLRGDEDAIIVARRCWWD